MGQAYGVAQTPFSTPVAPVAGFAPQQQEAFQATEAAQGMAQPYINQAANYFSPQGTQQFLNPYTQNVTQNLQDIFGQQMTQATGQAVQQAGGQGADRVAVAQSELAKQQGLAAGQTYAGLYGNAAQLAQGAGFGTANLGTAAQNAQLQGAQALLGTGGLQQQLAQAQLNAPYQNILQQIAWPYQNAQFAASTIGALAPGLGGTTAGAGTNTYPGASMLGPIAGLGLAGAGVYGLGNQQGWWGGGGGQGEQATGEAGTPGYATSARGGRIRNPYAAGGAADGSDADFTMPVMQQQAGTDPTRYAEMQQLAASGVPQAFGSGQTQLPSGLSGAPINIAPQSEIPQTQITPIKANIPQLPQPQQQQGGSSKGSDLGTIGSIVGSVAKIAPLLMAARGGRIDNPYEHLDHIKAGMHRVFGRGGRNPYRAYDGGGTVDAPVDDSDLGMTLNIPDPFASSKGDRLEVPQAVKGDRLDITPPPPAVTPDSQGPDLPYAAGLDQLKPGMQLYANKKAAEAALQEPLQTRADQMREDMRQKDVDTHALLDTPSAPTAAQLAARDAGTGPAPAQVAAGDTGTAAINRALKVATRQPASDTQVTSYAPKDDDDSRLPSTEFSSRNRDKDNPYDAKASRKKDGLMDSPWMALLSAGLGTLAASGMRDARGLPTPPLSAIGAGGLQGISTLQAQRLNAQKDTTIEQEARKLDLTAEAERNKYSKMPPYQAGELDIAREKEEREKRKPVQLYNQYGMPTGSYRWSDEKQDYVPVTASEAQAAPVPEGSHDYRTGAPAVAKGADVPEPASVFNRSVATFKTDAEMYLETSKLPPAVGGQRAGPMNIAYNDAIKNYANAVAASRGLSPADVVEMQRSAPGMLKFILGPDGRATVSLGTAVRHLDTLREYAAAWKANDTQAINRLRVVLGREFGADAATNLTTAARIVGPEIIKALGVAGAGTAEEREHAGASFLPVASPEQLLGAVGVTQRLLGGQLDGKRRQAAAAGVTETRFRALVGDRPYEILSHAEGGGGGAASAPAPAPAPVPPKAPAGLPDPATRFNQLTSGGLSKADAYRKMHEEGYQ